MKYTARLLSHKAAALISFFILAAFSSAQPNAYSGNEKPKVKKEIRQDFDLRKNARALEKQVETEFDIFGKIVQFSEYDVLPEGRTSLNRQTINKYNSNGRRIGSMVYDYNNALLWSEDIKVDAYGRTIKSTQTDYTKIPQQSQSSSHEYDAQGNEILTRNYNGRDEIVSEKRRTFNNENEQILLQHWYFITDKDGKPAKRTVRTENQFNSQGHLVKSISDIQEGKRKWREIRHFENCAIIECDKYENGKLISHYRRQERDTTPNNPAYDVIPMPNQPFPMEYDDKERDVLAGISHTEFRTITLKTDKNGNINKKVIREYGEVFSVSYYTYDTHNYLIKEHTIFKADDSTEELRYEYDQHHNLIKETKLLNDQPVKELAVIYEYYNN